MSAPSSSRGSRPASLAGVPLLLFCSNAKRPYHQLSNFTAASVAVDGWTFPSVEHAYQSCKTDDRSRFAVGGDLAGEEAFSLLFPAATCEAKRRYWMAKGNLGVLAKMATKDGAMRRLGLRRNRDFVESEELWMRLLEAKYAQEPFKSLLRERLPPGIPTGGSARGGGERRRVLLGRPRRRPGPALGTERDGRVSHGGPRPIASRGDRVDARVP